MHETKDWYDIVSEWFSTGIPKKVLGMLVAGFVSMITTERQNKTLTFGQKIAIWFISVFVGWIVYLWAMALGFTEWAFLVGMTASSFGATIFDGVRQILPSLIGSAGEALKKYLPGAKK